MIVIVQVTERTEKTVHHDRMSEYYKYPLYNFSTSSTVSLMSEEEHHRC